MILLNYIISKQLVCALLIIIKRLFILMNTITLQFPFILNIKNSFILLSNPILKLGAISLLISQHCVLQLSPNLVGLYRVSQQKRYPYFQIKFSKSKNVLLTIYYLQIEDQTSFFLAIFHLHIIRKFYGIKSACYCEKVVILIREM